MTIDTKVWDRWVSAGAIYAIVAGLGIVLAALAPRASGLAATANMLFWPSPERSGPLTGSALLATAVSGALTAGWGVMVWYLRPAFASTPLVAGAVARGLLAWFVLDSTASVLVGGALNVLGNVTLLVALLPPTWALSARRRNSVADGT